MYFLLPGNATIELFHGLDHEPIAGADEEAASAAGWVMDGELGLVVLAKLPYDAADELAEQAETQICNVAPASNALSNCSMITTFLCSQSQLNADLATGRIIATDFSILRTISLVCPGLGRITFRFVWPHAAEHHVFDRRLWSWPKKVKATASK